MQSRMLLAGLGLACVTCAPALGAGTIDIATSRGAAIGVSCSDHSRLGRTTADWLAGYLKSAGFRSQKVVAGDGWGGPLIALETLDACPIAVSVGISPARLDGSRADAYLLDVMTSGGRPVVCVLGRNTQGMRSGLARLVALLQRRDGRLSIPQVSEVQSPFFPIRRLEVAVTGRICEYYQYNGLPESAHDWTDTLWTNWSDDRIRRYVEQLWLYGFNSLEVGECRGYRNTFTDEQLQEKVIPKMRTMMAATHDYGMQTCQFIWGQSLFTEGKNLCWNLPEERAVMQREFRRLAETYGDLVDHVVVHVGDPGGCSRNGCDSYKTTQELATFIQGEYRKVNPRVTVTLSTWANAGFWNGAQGVTFLDESYSPKDIGIALHRWYDAGNAKRVLDSGRKFDIWGWYLGDMEMNLDMTLSMSTLDKYFSSLPQSASDQVRAISTEICFHGWPQIINAYVSAQKMWNPYRKLDEIEREFCAASFGEVNADAMLSIYKACEKYVHPERYGFFRLETDCTPVVIGSPSYNRELRKALALSERLDYAALDHVGVPLCTLSHRDTVDQLLTNLRLISVFSEGMEEIAEVRKSGGDCAAVVKRVLSDAEPYKHDLDYTTLVDGLNRMVSN